MRHFPIFLDLHDKPVVVFGTAPAADTKAEQLSRAGARVRREPVLAELGDVALVICADADDALGVSVAAAARAARIPVNVVDRPELCDFVWPAIVERDPVTIAISTAGTSPVLARRLRMRVEAAVPSAFGRLAAFAGALRARVARAIPDGSRRRLFWESVFDGQVASLVLAGRENEAGRALDRALLGVCAGAGHVSFIDVGSGDPDLLTLKALRRLQEADVLVCDFQFDPRVLDLARRDAERIRSAPGSISAWLVELARAGKQVVCLTDIVERGDEHKALADANITFETVPSVARPAEPVPVRARG